MRTLSRALNKAQILERELSPQHNFDLDLARAYALNYNLDRALELVKDLQHTLNFARDCKQLRLDVAVPEQVQLQRSFDVAVALRLTYSPLLMIDNLTQIKSGLAQLLWSPFKHSLRLRLIVTAPECHIRGKESHSFRLTKSHDSPVFYFHLIPQHTGDLSITVTLYQEDDTLGSARVRTVAIQQVAGEVQFTVASEPVAITNYNITIKDGGQVGVIGSEAQTQDGIHFESTDSEHPQKPNSAGGTQ